jgi:hypothetical protein
MGRKLNKKIDKQIANMPKYKINQEVFDTQSLARSRAFGRDRAIQTAQEDLEQGAADASAEARDVTNSTSGLLSTIASINANTTAGRRGLAQDEATIQRENVGDLYAANTMVGEEKDKAWNQNVFAPWEAKLGALKQKQANRNQLTSSIVGGLLSGVGSLATGGAFGAGGTFGKAAS